MARLLDLVGSRFGRLMVLHRGEPNRFGQSRWWCRCDCGAEKLAEQQSLRCGFTKSCGCLRREIAKHPKKIRHGEYRSVEYAIWRSMNQRCSPSARLRDRAAYAARGIRVCARWRSFENFLADMGRRPSPAYTLERIDNERGYDPGNVVWATRSSRSSAHREAQAEPARLKSAGMVHTGEKGSSN